MARHKYKFSNQKHSVGGVISTIMGVFSLLLLIYSIYLSFKSRGVAGSIVGSITFGALAFSVLGCVMGLISFRESDRFHTFSFIGSLLCGIMTIIMIMLLVVGL